MAIEPPMNAPDWDRYHVKGNEGAPVGDPTLWGAQAFTRLVVDTDIYSRPIISLATRDSYARSWSLLGSLTLPPTLWDSPFAFAGLECLMGVGQAQVKQTISLLFDNGGVTPRSGLCVQQHVQYGSPGGVFISTLDPSTVEIAPPPADLTFPFAAIGALVGQTISIRARYIFRSPLAQLPASARMNLIVTPYAAGERL